MKRRVTPLPCPMRAVASRALTDTAPNTSPWPQPQGNRREAQACWAARDRMPTVVLSRWPWMVVRGTPKLSAIYPTVQARTRSAEHGTTW